jgi:phosphate butyryltransferase
MKINNFKDLVINVQKMEKKSKVAVIAAHDGHTLDAIVEAKKHNLITPILIGDRLEIDAILGKLGENPEQYQIVAAADEDACIKKAVDMVHAKTADVIMKGKLETGPMMKAIVSKENGLKKGGIISVVGFYETDKYHKLFAVTDMAVNIYPDLEAKKQILQNAVNLLHALGFAEPKVAVLAAVEKLNLKMPETVDADALKQMNISGEITGCVVEGPISFDLATSKEAADIKGYQSPVAGDADLLLAPEITTGNVLVKCLTGMAGATTAGLVVGAKVPVVLTSRSAEASDKYYSIALAAYAAANNRGD